MPKQGKSNSTDNMHFYALNFYLLNIYLANKIFVNTVKLILLRWNLKRLEEEKEGGGFKF